MVSSSYEAVIFDWDGCLAQTLHIWANEFQKAFNKLGFNPTFPEISSRFGQWDRVTELGVPVDGVKQFNDRVRKLASIPLRTVNLYDGAKEMLIKLKQERFAKRIGGIALLTGSYLEEVQAPLDYHEIANL